MDIQEEKRLKALRDYDIIDSEAEKAFDNLTKLAAQICGTSVSQINFLTENRQWAKSTTGWGPPELPRDVGFCTHAIKNSNQSMVVEDTLLDERFVDNPLVTGDPSLRFYAGIPLKSEDDHPLGALCVYDSTPKKLTEQQLESLQILANEVETHLRLRVNQDLLKERLLLENKFNQEVINSLPINFFMYDKHGKLIRWNKNIKHTTGYTDHKIQQMKPEEFFDDEHQDLVLEKIDQVFQGKEVLFEAKLIAADGSSLPFIFSATSFVMENETFLIGTGQNITEQKEIQHKLSLSTQEKNVILAELHHRVKNNLAVISSTIQLETLKEDVIDSEKALQNTILRIQTMARVHEVMYDNENLAHVAFDEVVKTIVDNIKNTFDHSNAITLTGKVSEIILNINQAIPLSMIVNELLKNAWKHAYPNEIKGEVVLELSEQDGKILLRIADKGQGLPEDVDPTTAQTSGLSFVKNFCTQLHAEVEINQQSGVEYIIQFEKKETKGPSNTLNIQYH